jgi:hypothetical protein
MKEYKQCKLRRGTAEVTAWIETRGAHLGKSVELKPTGDFWEVVEVHEHTLPEDVLREQKLLNRNSLPSVEGMG